MEGDQSAKLGIFVRHHLDLLSQTKLLPLETIFKVSSYELLQQGNHSRSIFYAESWALIHYLILNGKSEGLNKFLLLMMKHAPPQQAFEESFQMTYQQMEKELSKYVSQNSYKYVTYSLKNKLTFDSDMQTSPLSEAKTNAYLGDLLFHTNRTDDAEPFLQKAITLDANQSTAYTTLGMVRFRQGRFDEAKNYLEKAVSDDQKNALALYFYAYALSRSSENNLITTSYKFSPDVTIKMQAALKKAIQINPTFTESYELLAYVNLVNNEGLDEAIQLLRKALTIEPGSQKYAIRIAEIYLRQEKYDEAKAIAEKIANTADEPQTRLRAENLRNSIQQVQDSRARYEASRKQYEESIKNNNGAGGGGQPNLARRVNQAEKQLTPEEVAKLQEDEKMISLNQALRKVQTGEKQVIGRIIKIACVSGKISYSVKTDKETLSFFSKDFQNLALVALIPDGQVAEVGCNTNLAKVNAVLTYKESGGKTGINGELVAVDFVPDSFKFVDTTKSQAISASDFPTGGKENSGTGQQNGIMQSIKSAMRQPQAGEKREQGFIEKVDCDNKGMTISFKTESQTERLAVNPSQPMQIRAFTKDIQQSQFGCGMKSLDVPAVFTYRPNTDPKAKTNGELVNLEFMPKDFKLEN